MFDLLAINAYDLAAPVPAAEHATHSHPDLLACIRGIESNNDYSAVSPSGKHLGAYQFEKAAWSANFGDRSPAEVPPSEQDALARNYISRRGLQPWPLPSKVCR